MTDRPSWTVVTVCAKGRARPMTIRHIRWLRACVRRRRRALQAPPSDARSLLQLLLVLRAIRLVAAVTLVWSQGNATVSVSVPHGRSLLAPPLHAAPTCPTTADCRRHGSGGISGMWSSRRCGGRRLRSRW